MRLPEIDLDDRRFQDLVNEARRRITRTCPEWSDHNVSDPGITLVELFAWMTEMTIYRLNRVPDKLHVKLLELMGISLGGPAAATAQIRFRLAAPATSEMFIPAGDTAVGTVRSASEESIVFELDEDFTVPALRPAAYVVTRRGATRDVGVAEGVARPSGADQPCFGSPPAVDDAFYLGFHEPIGRMLIQVSVESSHARGAGVDPDDPPLRWEVSQPDGSWAEAEILTDSTGGFNYGSGTVELELPWRSAVQPLGAHSLHWLRCRINEKTISGRSGVSYSNPPEIYSITASALGAILETTHAAHERNEVFGTSDGTPGQIFQLRHRPLLTPNPDETVEVFDAETGDWITWDLQDDFGGSTEEDLHYRLDPVVGEVEFGPAIREADGSWSQYGAVPPKDAPLRFTSYRYGGGREGNVAANTLIVLKSSIPGIDSVTNPEPATGGVDAESLEQARQRAAMEIRTRYRAVTAEDFEFLTVEASQGISRAFCVSPTLEEPRTLVRVLPRIEPADRRLTYDELVPSDELLKQVGDYLGERRLLGTTVWVTAARFRGVTVVVNIQASANSDPERVEEDVSHALYTYLNPLVGGDPNGPGEGWPFGRTLNQGELYGIVQSVQGVELIRLLRTYETNLETNEQSPKPTGPQLALEPDEVIASGQHIVRVTLRER